MSLDLAQMLGVVGRQELMPHLFRMYTPINQVIGGPLPLGGSFHKRYADTTVIMFAAGSMFVNSGNSMGINVWLDGAPVFYLGGFTNEVGSHKLLAPRFGVFPDTAMSTSMISAGDHTVEMTVDLGTCDTNDRYELHIWELPRP